MSPPNEQILSLLVDVEFILVNSRINIYLLILLLFRFDRNISVMDLVIFMPVNAIEEKLDSKETLIVNNKKMYAQKYVFTISLIQT